MAPDPEHDVSERWKRASEQIEDGVDLSEALETLAGLIDELPDVGKPMAFHNMGVGYETLAENGVDGAAEQAASSFQQAVLLRLRQLPQIPDVDGLAQSIASYARVAAAFGLLDHIEACREIVDDVQHLGAFLKRPELTQIALGRLGGGLLQLAFDALATGDDASRFLEEANEVLESAVTAEDPLSDADPPRGLDEAALVIHALTARLATSRSAVEAHRVLDQVFSFQSKIRQVGLPLQDHLPAYATEAVCLVLTSRFIETERSGLRRRLLDQWGGPAVERVAAAISNQQATSEALASLGEIAESRWEELILTDEVQYCVESLASLKEATGELPEDFDEWLSWAIDLADLHPVVAVYTSHYVDQLVPNHIVDERSPSPAVAPSVDPEGYDDARMDPDYYTRLEATSRAAQGFDRQGSAETFLELEALRSQLLASSELRPAHAGFLAMQYATWLDRQTPSELDGRVVVQAVDAISELLGHGLHPRDVSSVAVAMYSTLLAKGTDTETALALIPLLRTAIERHGPTASASVAGTETSISADDAFRLADLLLRLAWLHAVVGDREASSDAAARSVEAFERAGPTYAHRRPEHERQIRSHERILSSTAAERLVDEYSRLLTLLDQERDESFEVHRCAANLILCAAELPPGDVAKYSSAVAAAAEYAVKACQNQRIPEVTRAGTMAALASRQIAKAVGYSEFERRDLCRRALVLADRLEGPGVAFVRVNAARSLLSIRIALAREDIARVLALALHCYKSNRHDRFCLLAVGMAKQTGGNKSLSLSDRAVVGLFGAEALLVAQTDQMDPTWLVVGLDGVGEQLRFSYLRRFAYQWLSVTSRILEAKPELASTGHKDAIDGNRLSIELTSLIDAGDVEGVRRCVAMFEQSYERARDEDGRLFDTAVALATALVIVRQRFSITDRLISEAVLGKLAAFLESESATMLSYPERWFVRAAILAEQERLHGVDVLFRSAPEGAEELAPTSSLESSLEAVLRTDVIVGLAASGHWQEALGQARWLVGLLTWDILQSPSMEAARTTDWLGDLSRRLATAAYEQQLPLIALESLELGRAHMILAAAQAGWQDAWHSYGSSLPLELHAWSDWLTGVLDTTTQYLLMDDADDSATDQELLSVEPLGTTRLASLLDAFRRPRSVEADIPLTKWQALFSVINSQNIKQISKSIGMVVVTWTYGGQSYLLTLAGDASFGWSSDVLHAESSDAGAPAEAQSDDLQRLLHSALESLGSTKATAEPRRAIMVAVGDEARIVTAMMAAFGQELLCTDAGLRCQGITLAPSLRVVSPQGQLPDIDRPIDHPIRAVHFGDATNTLIGPWLEASSLTNIEGLQLETITGASITRESLLDKVPGADLAILSMHGIGAHRARESAGTTLADGHLPVIDMVAAIKQAPPSLLILGSCELGRSDRRQREYDAISFASAALAAGVSVVVAAVDAADDLPSAVLVATMVPQIVAGADPASAFFQAQDILGKLQSVEFRREVERLLDLLFASPLVPQWPEEVVRRACEEQVERLRANGDLWTQSPFVCLSR